MTLEYDSSPPAPTGVRRKRVEKGTKIYSFLITSSITSLVVQVLISTA